MRSIFRWAVVFKELPSNLLGLVFSLKLNLTSNYFVEAVCVLSVRVGSFFYDPPCNLLGDLWDEPLPSQLMYVWDQYTAVSLCPSTILN